MSDDIEYGPDPNDIRKHQKKMLTNAEYYRTFYRIGGFVPHPKQLEFLNSSASEVALIAGNQQGKTHCVGVQMALDLTGLYDDFAFYKGVRLPAGDMLAWAASTTSQMTRDGVQTKLLGDLSKANGLGQGLIPLDFIAGKPTMNRGISNFVDSIPIARDGGTGVLRLKTYEQGQGAFQTEPVHRIWLDEDPGRGQLVAGLWGEVIVRTTTTKGRIYFSATAAKGLSPIVKHFRDAAKARSPHTVLVRMGINDALHIPPEEIAARIARCPPNEVDCRIYGEIMQGEGPVFDYSELDIIHDKALATFANSKWAWGLDFAHSSGSENAHPFAAVLCAYDEQYDRVYVMHEYRVRGKYPNEHCTYILNHECGDARVLWPHDGGRHDLGGETIATLYKNGGQTHRGNAGYRRGTGLNMDSLPATSPQDFEPSITELGQRLRTGRLLIYRGCPLLLEELRNYHREGHQIVREDDDLVSAMRTAVFRVDRFRLLDGVRDNKWHEPERGGTTGLDEAFWDFYNGRR